ncbi:heat shock 70 kDa protein 12A-like [Pezoporus flaviventris]|uniref:heat shock 70 kDa protein 12A-like n=2 Tax=Pezoporus TaxID=35539 RepID=UPI002AB226EA|nr:heat shock 70 kDa protein 12A-like [Pezoporus flaviventris]
MEFRASGQKQRIPKDWMKQEQLRSFVFVCVCVGGTIDITVHEIQENHYLKELHKASGGGWGGNRVDQNFIDFLREIFDDGVWNEYEEKYPTELQHMMYNFGLQKCSASREDVYIRCYYNLTKLAECEKNISHFFKKHNGVVWCDRVFMVTYEKMKTFFNYSIRNIIHTLRVILDKPEMAKVQYILLVGGFSSSIILRDEISEAFSEGYHILCPLDAQAGIVKRAVLFGVNPCIVASRVSAQTYGIAVAQEFNAPIHDLSKKRISEKDGYIYCTDLFKKLVGMDESVNINKEAQYYFHPVEADQTQAKFSFYCTEKQDAQYVDEEGMEFLGSCTVPMPDTKQRRKRQLKLDIKFGLTEFKATCTDITSKQRRTITVDFLSV